MATPAYKLRFTYEDYLLFPDDGRRHELIGGEHYVTAAPFRKHQDSSGNLYRLLSVFIYDHRLGRLYHTPFAVVLSDEDVVHPDIVFVSNERSPILTDRGATGAPDLVIEILSESTRKTDETVKRKLYEWAGVLEYWVVDPILETVKVYRLNGGIYERIAELSVEAGGRLETPLLPGLTIALDKIFE